MNPESAIQARAASFSAAWPARFPERQIKTQDRTFDVRSFELGWSPHVQEQGVLIVDGGGRHFPQWLFHT